ncbi:MAG: pantoate--beta-alanine ligase [bacterium]|nr:pantoate--beta-alanine ligase [bacterium]
MEIFKTPETLHAWCADQKRQGFKIGLVPTMGNLHEGHMSLIREAKQYCDKVVVSIFVNPTQFAPNEDYDNYPRTEVVDCEKCEAEGAAAAFLPAPEVLYATDASTWVHETELERGYCGAQRPIHFRGVCTVVAKLFNIVQPEIAVFGQKDFQQVAVISRMVRDLSYPIQIIRAPIVREADGLAMSSRNAYLSAEQRVKALSLSRALFAAQKSVAEGERDSHTLEAAIRAEVVANDWLPDYVNVIDSATLMPIEKVVPGASAILLACRCGGLRLIDNVLL